MEKDFSDYKTKTKLILPFKGAWVVGNGGRSHETNNHRREDGNGPKDQTFAYDFKGEHKNDGQNLEDYEVFGQEVLAPADGTICQVINGAFDIEIGFRDRSVGIGNSVIIDHHNDEWSVIGHMKQDSVQVKLGDEVTQGDTLGLCGNTGNTSEPHIHYHLMNNDRMYRGEGLPALFEKILVDGKEVENAEPIRGQQVSNII